MATPWSVVQGSLLHQGLTLQFTVASNRDSGSQRGLLLLHQLLEGLAKNYELSKTTFLRKLQCSRGKVMHSVMDSTLLNQLKANNIIGKRAPSVSLASSFAVSNALKAMDPQLVELADKLEKAVMDMPPVQGMAVAGPSAAGAIAGPSAAAVGPSLAGSSSNNKYIFTMDQPFPTTIKAMEVSVVVVGVCVGLVHVLLVENF
jgi:hypothetical protein